ncbi:hypothetical protein AWC38_SpisGene522 [Stylophora pistillata]|uniref:Ashwin n=2 Tax=Stylophora pistillata TaxID=50429 RepID=A0A2B4SV33_STYPI|nr:hypothetical protein AWC38_SpisGene522 [Stylophora pistillata]
MADAMRPSGSNELDHPEVLSRERLLDILCDRSIPREDLICLEKGDLVQIFYKYVTPLPQRLHQLRRARRRQLPCGEQTVASNGKTSTIIRPTKRKSHEKLTTRPIKISRTEHSNSIKINRSPISFGSTSNGVNSVSIHTTSPTMDITSDHEGRAQNKSIKPKVVKLNRKTLGLHVDKSFEHQQSKNESNSSFNGGAQKEVSASSTSGDSGSDVNDSKSGSTKRKFEKVAVTWP